MTWWRKLFGLPEKEDEYFGIKIPKISKEMLIEHGWTLGWDNVNVKVTDSEITITKIKR